MSKKKKDYSGFLGWYHKQRDDIVAAVPARTRKKLLEDKEYRAKITAYVTQINRDDYWAHCKANDLNPSTGYSYTYCYSCKKREESGPNTCHCDDDY